MTTTHGPASTAARDRGALEAFALRDLRTRLLHIGATRLLVLLDLAALLLVAATYLQLGAPEFLFHGVFVVLIVDAFLYGRRVCLTRIAVTTVFLLAYAALPALGMAVDALDLTEWPLMFAIAILVAWMADRERTAVRRYARLYRSARDRLVTAQEEERRRLSRDLHDGIGQTLTALTLALDATAAARPDDEPRHLARARHLATEALAEVRSVAERVRPPRLEARGLTSALHEMARSTGSLVAIEVDPAASEALPPPHVLEVYRIAQEALGNAVRHAHAVHIVISVDRVHDRLRLRIVDDGGGFDPRHTDSRRLGLTGMRERAVLMGARLRVTSSPGNGTAVTLLVPLARSTSEAVSAASVESSVHSGS
ncbi:MAG: sensor histidine kinase [Chloroflexota bacterium]